ncbi:HNH endonuclease [Spirulina sp.]|uniref:HNH endonuclease n=1 Tax=Spirulina sp. TaxID=1157 RepID=UPI003F71F499
MSPAHLSSQTRQAVAQRARGLCEYCQSPEAYCPDSFTVDHVVPRQQGGTDDLENLAWACFGCNGRKHTKTEGVDPQTQQRVTLFNPRQQQWSEHFTWCEDLQTVIGKTSYGRVTVAALSLNRLSVVNLRRVLMRVGEHPAQVIE